MYASWCYKIAPLSPWAYACVWAEENSKQSRFHLGASLGGYRLPQHQDGSGRRWVSILQQAHFEVLRDHRIDAAGITSHSSGLRSRNIKIIPYGNCAETYPLVHFLR